MRATGKDIRILAGARICTIGPATAEEVHKHLLRVEKVPREYRAEGVLEAFSNEPSGRQAVSDPSRPGGARRVAG